MRYSVGVYKSNLKHMWLYFKHIIIYALHICTDAHMFQI